MATTFAVVLAHLAIEIVGAALLGYYLIFLLPFVGGVIGGLPVAVFQWVVLRRVDKGRLWIALTIAGFFGAWVVAMLLAAIAFVPFKGIGGMTAFLCFAAATPIIGLAQTVALRLWTSRTLLWVVASAVGWSAFLAVEFFANKVFAPVNALAARRCSAAFWRKRSPASRCLTRSTRTSRSSTRECRRRPTRGRSRSPSFRRRGGRDRMTRLR